MKKHEIFHIARIISCILVFSLVTISLQAVELVKNGKPMADIVIAEQPPRMTKLAAEELQTYVEKISGAKLPITNSPAKDIPVHIYVGRTTYTDKLNITDEGLKRGAFRMISAKNYLVLLGHDGDFTPRGPIPQNSEDTPRMVVEWDALTGSKWDNPVGSNKGSMPIWKKYNKEMGIWQMDIGGSLNAVHELLRSLGVRWYMPGELGEVVPKTSTIKLPRINKVIHPDFSVRWFYFAPYLIAGKEDILWYLRLGLNHGEEIMGGLEDPGHGIENIQGREEMQQAHPEYYALWGEKRVTSENKPCFSSEGLFRENVRYVRAMFDIYDVPMVSVMPQDGLGRACECDLCKGKETPERGRDGLYSDYVWSYVNRVAREVHKTHPEKKISCYAYSTYTLPPEKIENLSPNLVVGLVQCRRFFNDRGTRWLSGQLRPADAQLQNIDDNRMHEQFVKLRQAWQKKVTPGEILIWDHYPFTGPGQAYEGMPAYFPRLIAEDLRSLKGISQGEFIEVGAGSRGMVNNPGFSHLNIYVTSRLYWDANQDVDIMLNEYYRNFYGPAAKEMKAFIDYCEANWYSSEKGWLELTKNAGKIENVFKLLGKARQKVANDSVYGQRIALVADFLKPLEAIHEKLVKSKENPTGARQ